MGSRPTGCRLSGDIPFNSDPPLAMGEFHNVFKFYAYSVNKRLLLTAAKLAGDLPDLATTNVCKVNSSNRNRIKRSRWMKWLITRHWQKKHPLIWIQLRNWSIVLDLNHTVWGDVTFSISHLEVLRTTWLAGVPEADVVLQQSSGDEPKNFHPLSGKEKTSNQIKSKSKPDMHNW